MILDLSFTYAFIGGLGTIGGIVFVFLLTCCVLFLLLFALLYRNRKKVRTKKHLILLALCLFVATIFITFGFLISSNVHESLGANWLTAIIVAYQNQWIAYLHIIVLVLLALNCLILLKQRKPISNAAMTSNPSQMVINSTDSYFAKIKDEILIEGNDERIARDVFKEFGNNLSDVVEGVQRMADKLCDSQAKNASMNTVKEISKKIEKNSKKNN